MSENTTISWCNHTFNPWSGCHKVSPACTNCYAAALPPSMRRGAEWGRDTPRVPASDAYWREPVRWNAKAEKRGERMRVFCASTADVFEARDDLDGYRARLWALIEATPMLDWLLLTKRPEQIMQRIPPAWRDGCPPNTWMGATVEDQERADERIPHLLRVPAHVRWLSMEPLGGPVDIAPWLRDRPCTCVSPFGRCPGAPCASRLGWIVCGGESGHGARPSHPEWFRSLRDQCAASGVPFHFKQWGAFGHSGQIIMGPGLGTYVFREFTSFDHWVAKGPSWLARDDACLDTKGRRLLLGRDFIRARDESTFPVVILSNVGKKAAGRSLDGVVHDGFPS